MLVNPSNTQTNVAGRKTVIVNGKQNIEFEFNRINRSSEYDDIIIQFCDEEYNQLFGKLNNPFFIRDNTLYAYYKTNDAEYIKIVDTIGLFIAKVYNLKLEQMPRNYNHWMNLIK